jgi:L-threonine kinase
MVLSLIGERMGVAKAPGSCGELVQGMIDGVSFHISCPIDIFSKVKVILDEDKGEIKGFPARWKTNKAIVKMLRYFGLEGLGGRFEIFSDLPLEKGMTSSTADIGAACLATARALRKRISPRRIAQIALSIEPTDGTIFDGIAIFDHRNGSVARIIGSAPMMSILVIDLGGKVNTLKFNERNLAIFNKQRESETKRALQMVSDGIRTQDVELIARGATLSAFSNQAILYKPELPKIWEISDRMGALGVTVAHSGTLIGILTQPSAVDFGELRETLQDSVSGKLVFYETRLVNGGVRVVEE